MVTLLAKIFIQEKNDQAKIREEYGVLCGVVGILFNVLLFAGKFLAGTISHSIAITADAVNNLSDAGSSIVTLAGFKLAAGIAGELGAPYSFDADEEEKAKEMITNG